MPQLRTGLGLDEIHGLRNLPARSAPELGGRFDHC